jgi:hypothetical protein
MVWKMDGFGRRRDSLVTIQIVTVCDTLAGSHSDGETLGLVVVPFLELYFPEAVSIIL